MSFGKYVAGAVVGGVIGAAIGMLLAPRSGVETREMIKEEAANRYRDTKKHLEDELHDKTAQVKAKAADIGDRVKQLSEELEAKGREVLGQGGGGKPSSSEA